jgi:hypothetical protein
LFGLKPSKAHRNASSGWNEPDWSLNSTCFFDGKSIDLPTASQERSLWEEKSCPLDAEFIYSDLHRHKKLFPEALNEHLN